jgi:hypothetical protein
MQAEEEVARAGARQPAQRRLTAISNAKSSARRAILR